MAPVAGSIADRKQDRTLEGLRLLERGGRPGPPVNGIAGVLAQIRARRLGEEIS
jgi:hypothetical protein